MPPIVSRPHSAPVPLIAFAPQAGDTRAVKPSGVDGVGLQLTEIDIPVSAKPSAWCTRSLRTRMSTASPVTPSTSTSPAPRSIPARAERFSAAGASGVPATS